MYATPQDLLKFFGPSEIAGISRPDDIPPNVRITGGLLRLTVEGGNRDGFSEEERHAADLCLERINMVLEQVSMQMDSSIARRYPLPLSAGTIADNPFKKICADLARFALDDDSENEVIKIRHMTALSWLEDVASGRVVLTSHSNPSSTGNDQVMVSPGLTLFGDLKGYS